MDTTPDSKKAIVQARLQARARRISMLRRRVVAGALASFVLAWGAVAQSGSLGTTTTAPVTGASVTAATSVVSDSSSATASTQTATPVAVTTSQS